MISTVSPSRSRRRRISRGDRRGDVLGFGQAARAGHAAGQVAAARLDDAVAAPPQRLQVGLGGRMLPHVHVHGRRQHHRPGEAPGTGWSGNRPPGRARACAIRSAVAGAITSRSFSCATRCARWRSPIANRSVRTLRPVSAAKVRGRTNSCAAAVMTTCTWWSSLHQQARQFGGLVGRDAAADAEDDLHDRLTAAERGLRAAAALPAPGR